MSERKLLTSHQLQLKETYFLALVGERPHWSVSVQKDFDNMLATDRAFLAEELDSIHTQAELKHTIDRISMARILARR